MPEILAHAGQVCKRGNILDDVFQIYRTQSQEKASTAIMQPFQDISHVMGWAPELDQSKVRWFTQNYSF